MNEWAQAADGGRAGTSCAFRAVSRLESQFMTHKRRWGSWIVADTRVGFDAYGATGRGLRAAVVQRSLLGVKTMWRRHHDLLSNASSLLATTGVTSALGFVYWAFAARLFSQQAVGYGAAAVSALTVLGTIGMLGLGTLLIGELPRRNSRAGLVSAALLACGLGSLVLGLGFAVVAPHVSDRFGNMIGTPGRAALFTAGVAVTGVTLVFDQATIGLMRGGLQLWRNTAFSFAKLLVLPIAAIILHDQLGFGITLSWVVGMALSLVLLAIRLLLAGTPVVPRPDWGLLRGLGRTAMAHNWLNLAITLPVTLMPVLVTVIVSPSANAAFYIASMLSGFLFILPTHLSTVLFAVVAAEPKVIARKLRFALRLSFMIGLPGMVVLILGSHLTLSLFGKDYAPEATLPLWLMAIGYPSAVPKALYIAVCRAAEKIPRAAAVLTACSALELAVAAAGGASGGLMGLSFALLAVRYVEALVTTPPVVRAAFGRGRHRRADSGPVVTSNPLTSDVRPCGMPPGREKSHLPEQRQPEDRRRSAPAASATKNGEIMAVRTDARKLDRQEAGIAALLSLARSTASTGPIPIATARLHPLVLVASQEPLE